jgi:hypothetical protein
MSLMHMVSFKYKADVPETTRTEHRARLQGLSGLAGVIDLRVGRDLVGSPRSYDTGLIVTFANREALDSYQTDPLHVPVAQYGASLCDSIVAVDFAW